MTPPSGVVISNGAITGNYDTATNWPLTVDLISSITIDSITIDDTPATLTEGVLQVPYTAQAITIVATASTAKGPETLTYEYSVDVDFEPLRIAAHYDTYTVDYYNHTITGERDGVKYIVLDIYRNGSRVSWAQRARYSYRYKMGEADWTDYAICSYNLSGASIAVPTDIPLQIQIKYTYQSTTEESEVFISDVKSVNVNTDDRVEPVTSTEGLIIDTVNHTITGTFAAADIINIWGGVPDVYTNYGNVALFVTNPWTRFKHDASDSSDITAAALAAADIVIPSSHLSADDSIMYWGPTYTVNITISE